MPSTDGTPRPSLKRELLVNFALLTGAAISLAVLSALIAQLFAPRFAALGIVLLIVADVLVLFAFGRYLLEKLVLGPVAGRDGGAGPARGPVQRDDGATR
jgi:4-amino-4-deoxy-L-arabinose transferase-like glycosyltransferase